MQRQELNNHLNNMFGDRHINIKHDYELEFQFLDQLRESAQVNMLGASAYLINEFGINKREARTILSKWINNNK